MSVKVIIMMSVLVLSLSTLVHSASFDCKKASNFAEREVCSDKELSKLDDKLSVLYKKIKKTAGDWRKSQLLWLQERNNCKTKQCLLTAYQTRVVFFESELTKNTVKITKGSAYQLCKDYVALMSRVNVNPESSCKMRYSFDVAAYDAGFADIMWKKVKKSEVKSVLLGYWLPREEISLDDFNVDMSQQKKFNEFYSTHKTIWQSNIDINFDGKKERVYKVSIAEKCSGHRFFYFVLPMFDRYLSTVTGDLFMYQGRPYLEYGALVELTGGENIIHEKNVCEFKK